MSGLHIDSDSNEQRLATLIGQAGPRHTAPATVTEQVRAAVESEWQQLLLLRRQQRQRRWLVAAGVLIAAIGVIGFGWQTSKPALQLASDVPPVLASISYLPVSHQGSGAQLSEHSMDVYQPVHANELLRTESGRGARMATSTGISLRIATSTQLRWINEHELQLLQGAVYVDSHNNAAALMIRTPQAQVTHVGTQYQVNTSVSGLIVSVRSGEANIHSAGKAVLTVRRSEQLRIDADGQSVVAALANDDASWQWVDALTEPFVLENRTVAEFLRWVANETGYQLHYTSPTVQAAADATVLHGKSTRMAPLQAMQMVLATTDMRATVQGTTLVVLQQ
jgi:ferric-dicitrate binding protein FerR (iron transport regulator)